MNPILAATHTVADAEAAADRFARWMDYRVVERGSVAVDLAETWGAAGSAGRDYTLCQPASGAEVFIRFVEGDLAPDYRPIRTYGWAAIEICVQDVEAVHGRMQGSPFEVIGPPQRIPGLATIHPMQVRGPDREVVYLTQILTDAPDSGLPQAGSPIDKLFIMVLACADMRATARWFAETLGVATDDPVAIRYTMISKAFDLPIETRHEIVTGRRGTDIYLEFDQYPPEAAVRPGAAGALPPGVSICTLLHPAIDDIQGPWLHAPSPRAGVLYGGRRTGVLRTPEGALVEVIHDG